jgi:hypothetical protein
LATWNVAGPLVERKQTGAALLPPQLETGHLTITRDGSSKETGLIDTWALNGENVLRRAPYRGRSAPVVVGK